MRTAATGNPLFAANDPASSVRGESVYRRGLVRVLPTMLAIAILAAGLFSWSTALTIPPLVESDYAYLLTAADRFMDGHGLTATPPVAPNQPWEWRGDWAFLTQWPCGFPLLIVAVRTLTGWNSLEACQLIAAICCALAFVGWLQWARKCMPGGWAGTALALIAAGLTLTPEALLNPSTDTLLIAALPWLLLLTCRAIKKVEALRQAPADQSSRQARAFGVVLFALCGDLAGAVCWIRYAAVFVPAGIGAYLLYCCIRRRIGIEHVLAFGMSAGTMIVALVAVNSILGSSSSATAQLNLGERTSFDFSWALPATAWWNFVDLGFYDYRPVAHQLLASWPALIVLGVLIIRPWRQRAVEWLRKSGVGLSAMTLVAMLAMLIGATTFFSGKFNYVGLERYYLPGRPFYLILFAAPVLLIRGHFLRIGAVVACLVAGHWMVTQDWQRPIERLQSKAFAATPYGERAMCFTPHADGLYERLKAEAADDLVVVSNYHEFIALETGIPALPIPPDREALNRWIEKIKAGRGIDDVRVLFVLDPDNRWRDYWIPSFEEITAEFDLTDRIWTDVNSPAYGYTN